jgi:hypothetical protein
MRKKIAISRDGGENLCMKIFEEKNLVKLSLYVLALVLLFCQDKIFACDILF